MPEALGAGDGLRLRHLREKTKKILRIVQKRLSQGYRQGHTEGP